MHEARALPSTSTLRACFGLAGADAGSAAIMASTCWGCGVLILRTAPRPPPRQDGGLRQRRGQPGGTCSWPSVPALALSHSPNQRSNVERISSRSSRAVLVGVDRREESRRDAAARPPRPPGPRRGARPRRRALPHHATDRGGHHGSHDRRRPELDCMSRT